MRRTVVTGIVLFAAVGLAACAPPPDDPARRGDVVEVFHGVEVADPYRWLEDGSSEEVAAWTEGRNATFFAATEKLPQRRWFKDRFGHLYDYDDFSPPEPCLTSERVVYRTRKWNQEKWKIHLKTGPNDEGQGKARSRSSSTP